MHIPLFVGKDKSGFYTTRFGKRDPDFTRFGRSDGLDWRPRRNSEDAFNRIFLARPTKRENEFREQRFDENMFSCNDLYGHDLGKRSVRLCYRYL